MNGKPMRFIVCLWSCLFLLVFAACHQRGEGKLKQAEYKSQLSAEMRAEFAAAENKFKLQQYAEAEQAYQAYVQKHPYNEMTDTAEFRLGQILMLQKQYGQAIQAFEKMMRRTSDQGNLSRARVKIGISRYRLSESGKALEAFDEAAPQYLSQHDQIKMGGLALKAIVATGGDVERKGFYNALLLEAYENLSEDMIRQKYGEEAPTRESVLNELHDWANRPIAISKLDPRLLKYKASTSAVYIDYKLGMSYYKDGERKEAHRYLNRLIERHPSSPQAEAAKPVFARLKVKSKPDQESEAVTYKIGVILPLSGKYASYGTSTLHGIECAASQKTACDVLHNLEVVVRDDQGDPELAVKAVEQLAKDDHVMAIVGPLSSASAEAAAKKSQELGVTMLSLAQKEGIPGLGEHIFRFSLTPDEQIRALLGYVAREKNKKLWAVLYPNSSYGKVFFDTLTQKAPQFGATVSASQAYAANSEIQEVLRQLKFSVAQTSAEAPLGFDTLFIPDSYLSILKLVPHLKDAGIDSALLVGTNAWNDPALAQHAAGLVDGAIFPDIYFKNSDNPLVRQIRDQFVTAFGQPPSTLEAIGFDAVRFLGQSFERSRPKHPEEVRRAVLEMRDYRGITGLRSFSSDREAELEPYRLTVENYQIREVRQTVP